MSDIVEKIAKYELSTDKSEKVILAREIAVYHEQKTRQFEIAKEYLQAALALAEELNDQSEISKICCHLGSVYRFLGDREAARESLGRAIKIGEELQDDLLLAQAYIYLGTLNRDENDFFIALDFYEKALNIAEHKGDRDLCGLAFAGIGTIYIIIDEPKLAVQNIRQALKMLPKDSSQRWVCYYNIALAYGNLGDHALAIGYFKRAIPLMEQINHHTGVAEGYCSIGESHFYKKNPDKAMEFIQRAKTYISEKEMSNKRLDTMMYIILMKIHLHRDEDKEMEECIQKFLALEVDDLLQLRKFYELVADYYQQRQKYAEALEYYNKFQEINKIILDDELHKNIVIKTANFEYEQEKQRAELLRQKNDELEEYQKIIESKNQELLSLQHEKDHLMNTISHDLKNFLGATQQALNILYQKEKSLVDNEYMKMMATSLEHSANLVNMILLNTKIDTQKEEATLLEAENYIAKDKKWRKRNSRQLIVILISIIVVFYYIYDKTVKDLQKDLLEKSQIVYSSMDIDDVKALVSEGASNQLPEYDILKELLIHNLTQFDRNLRNLYIMGQTVNDELAFLVDLERTKDTHEVYALDTFGLIYEDTFDFQNKIFRKTEPKPYVEGPYQDAYGRWISSIIPITDPETGEVLAFLGIDYDFSQWRLTILKKLILPVFLFFLVVLLAIRIYQIINKEKILKELMARTANIEYEREKERAVLLRQKNDELEEHKKEIEQKNDELLRLHAEKDNLLNTISHDLKNYLGATEQALQIVSLKDKALSENKYIKIISTSNSRSLGLVKEILYSSKITASKDDLSMSRVDISQVIASNEDVLKLRASKKGIKVVFEYDPEPLWVLLDSDKWHRVFENLTTNAIKFTPADKDICISTKREGDFALISIKDSGIGIAPENIGKLFTPFSGVGRKGTDGEESTGLGLSIVKKLVELHGGYIQVFSEVGKGTEFVVKLKIYT